MTTHEGAPIIHKPREISRRTVAGTAATIAFTAAAYVGLSAINGGGQQTISAETPRPSAAASEPPRPTAPIVIATEAPKPTASPEAPKALPEVMNKQTVIFVIKSPEEVQKMINEARVRGEEKIALPDVLNQSGVSIREIKNINGRKLFAISAETEGNYSVVAEISGTVDQITVSASNSVSTFNAIMLSQGKETWLYAVPDSASSQFKKDDSVKIGETVLSFKYDPKSPVGGRFINYLNQQFPGTPNNTIAVLGLNGVDLGRESILRTPTGEVVLISSQK